MLFLETVDIGSYLFHFNLVLVHCLHLQPLYFFYPFNEDLIIVFEFVELSNYHSVVSAVLVFVLLLTLDVAVGSAKV